MFETLNHDVQTQELSSTQYKKEVIPVLVKKLRMQVLLNLDSLSVRDHRGDRAHRMVVLCDLCLLCALIYTVRF